jgi:tetratricopeptide (TPR) repeat protein
MSTRLRLLLVLAMTSSSTLVAAQPAAPGASTTRSSSNAEARDRFQRGVTLYREGSFDAALAEFQRAYELAPNFRLLFNLAQVQVERHDAVAALSLFGRYLQEGGNEVDQERRTQVESDMQTLRSRVAELTVDSNVAGAQLSLDGVELGTLPHAAPVLVNSGVHQITLSKPGYQSTSRSLTIAGAQPLRLVLSLQSAERSPNAAAVAAPHSTDSKSTPEGAERSHGLSTPFWISAVTTGALTATAVTFGLLTVNRNQELDDTLNRFPTDPSAVNKARNRVKMDAALTDAFTAASVVGLATTVYFALKSGGTQESIPEKALRKDRLELGTNGSTLVLSGKF